MMQFSPINIEEMPTKHLDDYFRGSLMHKLLLVGFGIVLVINCISCSNSSRSSTATLPPKEGEKVEVDISTPKKALVTWFKAVRARDLSAYRQTLTVAYASRLIEQRMPKSNDEALKDAMLNDARDLDTMAEIDPFKEEVEADYVWVYYYLRNRDQSRIPFVMENKGWRIRG